MDFGLNNYINKDSMSIFNNDIPEVSLTWTNNLKATTQRLT